MPICFQEFSESALEKNNDWEVGQRKFQKNMSYENVGLITDAELLKLQVPIQALSGFYEEENCLFVQLITLENTVLSNTRDMTKVQGKKLSKMGR